MCRIINNSKKEVLVKINDMEESLSAGEQIDFKFLSLERYYVTLNHTKDSYKKRKMAHINIETKYVLTDLTENAELIITREKMKIDEDIFYDCFFLNVQGKYIEPLEYNILGEQQLKEKMNYKGFSGVFESALESMLGDVLSSLFITILIGFMVTYFFGWEWLLVGIVCVYLVYVVGVLFGDALARMFAKRTYETVEQRLSRVIDKEYIVKFYSNPNRSSYNGKIER